MDKTESKIIERLSLKYDIPSRIMKEICHSQYEFAYKKIKELDLKNKTDEEIKKEKTNFRFRFLFTLFIPQKLLNRRKRLKEIQNGNKDQGSS